MNWIAGFLMPKATAHSTGVLMGDLPEADKPEAGDRLPRIMAQFWWGSSQLWLKLCTKSGRWTITKSHITISTTCYGLGPIDTDLSHTQQESVRSQLFNLSFSFTKSIRSCLQRTCGRSIPSWPTSGLSFASNGQQGASPTRTPPTPTPGNYYAPFAANRSRLSCYGRFILCLLVTGNDWRSSKSQIQNLVLRRARTNANTRMRTWKTHRRQTRRKTGRGRSEAARKLQKRISKDTRKTREGKLCKWTETTQRRRRHEGSITRRQWYGGHRGRQVREWRCRFRRDQRHQ